MRLQALSAPQAALQAFSIVHLPVLGEQYCPLGQTTPAHVCVKQPATHWPSTQVWLVGQVLPAQGSVTSTQVALQAVPLAHIIAVAATHGSFWQVPFRQT